MPITGRVTVPHKNLLQSRPKVPGIFETAMEEMKMSLRDVALAAQEKGALDMTPQRVHNIVSGKDPNPRHRELIIIGEVLGKSVTEDYHPDSEEGH